MFHHPKLAYVFPGHGSQFVGMGKDVYESFSEARSIFDKADAALGFSISKLCFEGPEQELCQPANVQPALLTVSMAILAVMRSNPTYASPAYTAGHSLGEYTALVASGVISLHDAVVLVRLRGQLMQQAGTQKPGVAAVIIGLSDDIVEALTVDVGVYVANYNYPGQVVISGELSRVEKALALAATHGAVKTMPLAGSVAFHSPLMQSATDKLAQAIAQIHFSAPAFPIVSNVSAAPINSADVLKDELTQQMCNPVQWSKSMSYLLAQEIDLLVEIGPGNVLSGLMKRIDKHTRTVSISDSSTLTNYLLKGFEL